MKIISLNTWGGKIFKPLMDFIKENSTETDIFCFQEVFKTISSRKEVLRFRTNLYEEIGKILQNHNGYFVSSIDNYLTGSFQKNFTDYNLSSGLAIFIKKELKIINHGDFFLYGHKKSYNLNDFNSMPKNAQFVIINTSEDEKLIICNMHGIWLRAGKKDSPSRIDQSEKLKNFLAKENGKKILCGDFNLEMNTKSIKILETNLRNLIKDCNIKTTRNKNYLGSEKFADYIFISKDINVENFEVPRVEISDHLPMILEFS